MQMTEKLEEEQEKNGAINAESLAAIIRGFKDDTNRAPSDADLEVAF